MVCARHLKHFGKSVSCCYPKRRELAPWQGLTKQCQALEIPFSFDLPPLDNFDLIVDAIFGYSFSGEIRAPFGTILQVWNIGNLANLFQTLSTTTVPIASIDIPSGWNVETGPSAEGIHPDFLSMYQLFLVSYQKYH